MLTKADPKTLRWQRSKYSLLGRQIDIFSSAAQFMFYLWWDKNVAKSSVNHRYRRAEWLVGTLLDLGPTFIKIGQALSTRADLLPKEYVKALATLQDQVPEFSSSEAIATIESELGNSLYSLFRDFDEFPIAAASLGQVHKARLHSGEDVVVKVQRPGLDKLFRLDFQVLRQLVGFSERFFPWTRKYELPEIYREFVSFLSQEIDYIQEGKNADRFRENFQDHPEIIVPAVYWRYSTQKILTMEYLPGIKIDDRQTLEACGIDVKQLNERGITCYLKQLLEDGFFQADPHPGNMAVNQQGCLIFYDFGMMAEIQSLAKNSMISTFFAVLRKDTEQVLNSLIEMGLIVPVKDMRPVRRLVSFLLENFTEKPLDIKALRELKGELYSMFEQQPFRLPAQMTFILKSLTTLDGIARTLDPHYNPVACAKPFVRRVTGRKGKSGVLGEVTRQARQFVQYKLKQPKESEVLLRQLTERIERGEMEFQVRSLASDRLLTRINLAVKTLIYACLFGFSLVAGAVLLVGSYEGLAIAAFCFCGFTFLIFMRALVRLSFRERLDKLSEE
ncbi:ABC1 kinase family protein [Phormidium sp. CCY1219]|uniref:ABC1 kinase family protein n=1 Tax=Phormidium sp. CCY1219 TaxID=2886104 RepID=UPI002D1ED2B3|nr:AarF/ABC1/UbiB kinase family protein [Phormidium sp. CCY1219]MEB3828099.1 AarF/ABC1/UbiB kinase family protein [Phormidium sp. CCY1219]